MGNQAEITGGIGVAKSGERTGKAQDTGNSLVGNLAETIFTNVHILAILADTGVDVHTTTSLANSNLRCKSDSDTILVAKLTHNPFGNNKLVGSILKISRKELNLILLVHSITHGEIAHLAMAILNEATTFGYKLHGASAVLGKFAERC